MAVGSGRLAIGTAQFGLDYGVANRSGRISQEEGAAILGYGKSAGMDTIDTAISYGESEQRLGEIGVAGWRVVSKAPPLPDPCADVGTWLADCITRSLGRLRVAGLYGLLLHRPEDLLSARGSALYQALRAAQDAGLISKIGVSIYDPAELDVLCERYSFDLVQAPFNPVDRRLVTSGWLRRLRESSVEVHTRSVFLQGLLLLPPAQRPSYFERWSLVWKAWREWLDESGQTAVQACLGVVSDQPDIDRVVIGVDSLAQFREVVAAATRDCLPPPATLTSDDRLLINPSFWERP